MVYSNKVITFIFIAAFNVFSVHVNQIGYYPSGRKTATVTDSGTAQYGVVDAVSGAIVFSGIISPKGTDNTAGETVSVADFTSFNKEGKYRLVYDNRETSSQFSIKSSCYKNSLNTVLKS
jgi:endoglucanase